MWLFRFLVIGLTATVFVCGRVVFPMIQDKIDRASLLPDDCKTFLLDVLLSLKYIEKGHVSFAVSFNDLNFVLF